MFCLYLQIFPLDQFLLIKYYFKIRKIPLSNERGSTSGSRKDLLFGGGSLQNEATARGNSSAETQSGTNEENGIGRYHIGRGYDGGDQRVQGNIDLSFMQSEKKGRGTIQMFPRFLLRLS